MPLTIKLPRSMKPPEKVGFLPVFTSANGGEKAILSGLKPISETFKLNWEPAASGSGFFLEDDQQTLEVYSASGSLRWEKRNLEEGAWPELGNVPSAKDARKRADDFLKAHLLWDERAPDVVLERSVTTRMLEDGTIEGPVVGAIHVQYGYQLSGLPVFGAGAKIEVTFDDSWGPVRAFRFFREPKKLRPGEEQRLMRAVVSPDTLAKGLANSPAIAHLTDDMAQIQVTSVRLGYLSAPPRETQRYLVPVFACEAELRMNKVSFRKAPYPFRTYVLAVHLDPTERRRLVDSSLVPLVTFGSQTPD